MDTCPPCRTLSALLNTMGTPKYPIENVDIKTNHQMRLKYKVNAVPVLIKVDEQGNEIQRIRGVRVNEIKKMLFD